MAISVLGIDPGSRITGYGIIEITSNHQLTHIAHGSIPVKSTDLAEQLKKIYTAIDEIIAKYRPQEVSVERIFMHENASSALKLGQARGVAIVAASQQAPLFEYTARQVKLAVAGYGAATKEQIQLMVCRLLKLTEKPAVDAADALAIAICHAHSRKMNAVTKTGLRIED